MILLLETSNISWDFWSPRRTLTHTIDLKFFLEERGWSTHERWRAHWNLVSQSSTLKGLYRLTGMEAGRKVTSVSQNKKGKAVLKRTEGHCLPSAVLLFLKIIHEQVISGRLKSETPHPIVTPKFFFKSIIL